MTQDEIIALAKEAGFTTATAQYPYEVVPIASPDQLARFFALAFAAGQRDMQERAANHCELIACNRYFERKQGPADCAAAIRNLEVK